MPSFAGGLNQGLNQGFGNLLQLLAYQSLQQRAQQQLKAQQDQQKIANTLALLKLASGSGSFGLGAGTQPGSQTYALGSGLPELNYTPTPSFDLNQFLQGFQQFQQTTSTSQQTPKEASNQDQQIAQTPGAAPRLPSFTMSAADYIDLKQRLIPILSLSPGEQREAAVETLQKYIIEKQTAHSDYGTEFNKEALAFGYRDPSLVPPILAGFINQRVDDKLLRRSTQRGAGAAYAREEAKYKFSLKLPLSVADQTGAQQYFDTKTGQRLTGGEIFGEVIDRQQKGNVTKLDRKQTDQMNAVSQGSATLKQLVGNLVKVYGPGGIFENLQASGRIPAGLAGLEARYLQEDPTLVVLNRQLTGLVERVGRQFTGAVGVQTERDVNRFQQLLAKVDGIPDSKDVAYDTMRELLDLSENIERAIVQNPELKDPDIDSIRVQLHTGSRTPITKDTPAQADMRKQLKEQYGMTDEEINKALGR